MRLWHYNLIPLLPRQQLLGQWRECIALLGNGWGKKHSTVNYVFKHDVNYLINYTVEIGIEMLRRKYKPNLTLIHTALMKRNIKIENFLKPFPGTYPEHNDDYLVECINNLKTKGIILKG